MYGEIQLLQNNHMWNMVVIPPNAIWLHAKWMHTTKRDEDGYSEQYKALLVACEKNKFWSLLYRHVRSCGGNVERNSKFSLRESIMSPGTERRHTNCI